MAEWYDDLTSSVKIATDTLFAKNPQGTALGTFAGIIIHGLLSIFSPSISSVVWINVEKIHWYHCAALGIFLFNFKSYFKRHSVNKEYEEKIRFVEAQERQGLLTKIEAKQLYRNIIAEAVERKLTVQRSSDS